MISQYTFNNAMNEINEAFGKLTARVAALEAQLEDKSDSKPKQTRRRKAVVDEMAADTTEN